MAAISSEHLSVKSAIGQPAGHRGTGAPSTLGHAGSPWVGVVGDAVFFEGMPGRLKVLYIATPSRTGAWLAEAFAADSAAEILLEEAAGQAAGMERLRDEVFDAILVSHEPGELDALDLVEGYRTGGAEEPIIVLGAAGEAEMAVLCYEVGADGYVCVELQHHAEPDLGCGASRPAASPGTRKSPLPPTRTIPARARTGGSPAALERTEGGGGRVPARAVARAGSHPEGTWRGAGSKTLLRLPAPRRVPSGWLPDFP